MRQIEAGLRFSGEAQDGTAQLIRKDEQMEVVRSGTRHGHTYRLLSYSKGRKKTLEPFMIEMDKASDVYPRFRHEGTEFIYMLSGSMEYRFGETTYLLEPGDALTFSAHIEHGPQRLMNDRIKFLSIIFYDENIDI